MEALIGKEPSPRRTVFNQIDSNPPRIPAQPVPTTVGFSQTEQARVGA